MDSFTISQLNALNLAFYRTTAPYFNDTRQTAWVGWQRLLPYLEPPIHVLDVGCGNGRFGVFLANHFSSEIRYHGIDSDTTLLHYADENLRQLLPSYTLTELDIIEKPFPSGKYNLVVAFGLLHHIPSRQNRLMFMQRLAEKVIEGGFLVFACWRFMDVENFRKRIVAWPEHLAREEGDYLLDWRHGQSAIRYCHYVDDTEHAALVQATGFTEVERYKADGRNNALNQYSILRH